MNTEQANALREKLAEFDELLQRRRILSEAREQLGYGIEPPELQKRKCIRIIIEKPDYIATAELKGCDITFAEFAVAVITHIDHKIRQIDKQVSEL